MKRRITIAMAVLAVALGSGAAWASSIVGSPHDLSSRIFATGGQVCLPCHAPHNGANPSKGPIWNHAVSSASFTRDGSPLTLTGNSVLCMGCHDGVTAVGSFNIVDSANITLNAQGSLTIQNLTSAATATLIQGTVYINNLTNDLSSTHPTSVAYPVLSGSDSSSFHAAAPNSYGGVSVGGKLSLEDNGSGTSSYVGCSTCHNPHDDSKGKFLRLSNGASALCLTCHIK